MKKTRLWLFMLAIMGTVNAVAQDSIKVDHFALDVTVAYATMDRVTDANGDFCAVIRVVTNDPSIEVEPLLGYEKMERRKGEILLWVQTGNRKFKISGDKVKPLIYVVNQELKELTTYEMAIVVVREQTYPFFINAGFNVTSIMGPSLSFGYHFGNFNIEAGLVLGLNSSDDYYFYDKDNSLKAAHSYKAFRVQARGGYDFTFPGAGFMTIEPQVGVAFNAIRGGDVSWNAPQKDDSYMKSLGSLSALAAVRLKFAINGHWKVQVTPEYDFGLSKNNSIKTLGDHDSKIKSWTDGVNLNVGVIMYF